MRNQGAGLRILPIWILTAVACSLLATGCREEDPVRTVANQGKTPTMVTYDVNTYVSDSGYIKYHAVTDIWEMYDDTTEPYWRFPRPLLIDILAPNMKPNAHIECDSAVYQTSRMLFRFDGDVTAINVMRDTFQTPQLYWDQRVKEFYTDSFIHIVKSDRILEGYGFRSNESMTRYTIHRPTAIMPASAFQNGDKDDDSGRRERRDSAENERTRMYGDDYRPAPVPASQRNRRSDETHTPASADTELPNGSTAPGGPKRR